MQLSVIVPVLNEEAALAATLRNVADCLPGCEVIAADGGSTDGTRRVVEQCSVPVCWLEAPRGRGSQMNAGAKLAKGDVLLFLHADTRLPANALQLIENALQNPAVPGGFFRIAFEPANALARLYAQLYNWRSRLKICYGDAALFVRRECFEQLGGYHADLIMEDIELVLRLRKMGPLAYLREGTVSTSSRRFSNTRSGLKMLMVWFFLHILMALGAPQKTMARFYPEVR